MEVVEAVEEVVVEGGVGVVLTKSESAVEVDFKVEFKVEFL